MVRLIICDLDNTIYNWVDFYVPSFNVMVRELSRSSGVKEEALRESFKRVHQKYRTTEYAFSIQELDVLAEANAGLTVPEILRKYDSSIRAFRSMRKKTLRLYDGVKETLQKLRTDDRKTVAYTDAMMFYAVDRIKRLGVEHSFDGLVAQRDHGIPSGTRPEDVRYFKNKEAYETSIQFRKELEPTTMKPNPEGLKEILRHFQVGPSEAMYVGDSLYKDIYMAQRCGVYDVFAEYGRRYNPEYYQQLVEITHWTENDVAKELKVAKVDTSATFSISHFGELVDVIRRIERKSRPESG